MSDRQKNLRGGGVNVLLQTSATESDDAERCLDFLTTSPPHQSNALFISYVRSPDDWMRTWLDQTGERPANLGIIPVGETVRTTAATQASGSSPGPERVVQPVGNPHDLTELGITISEYLSRWEDNPHDTLVCFDSVTAFLQYTDGVQTAFQFLHTLVGRIQTANARACYIMTPEAHDHQTVATLTTLFDDILE